MFVRWNETLKYYEYDTSAGQTGAGPWVQLPNIVYEDQRNVFTGSIQSIEGDHPMVFFKQMAAAPGIRATRLEGFSDFYISHVNDANDAYVKRFYFGRNGNFGIPGDIYEKDRSIPMGHWQDVPFIPSYFIPSAGTWTVTAGNITVNRYTVIGKTMIWTCRIQGSITSGALNQYMHIVLPAGVIAPAYSGLTRATEMYDGTTNPVRVYPYAGSGNLLTIEKETVGGSNTFNPGVLYLSFTITFEFN